MNFFNLSAIFLLLALCAHAYAGEGSSIPFVTKADFDFSAPYPRLKKPGVSIVKVGGSFCRPCVEMEKEQYLESIQEQLNGQINLYQVDYEPSFNLAIHLDGTLPALFVFDQNGNPIANAEGYALKFNSYPVDGQKEAIIAAVSAAIKGQAQSSLRRDLPSHFGPPQLITQLSSNSFLQQGKNLRLTFTDAPSYAVVIVAANSSFGGPNVRRFGMIERLARKFQGRLKFYEFFKENDCDPENDALCSFSPMVRLFRNKTSVGWDNFQPSTFGYAAEPNPKDEKELEGILENFLKSR